MQARDSVRLSEALAALEEAVSDAEALLRSHSYNDVAGRLHAISQRIAANDMTAVQWALSESTGSMGSLRDVYIYAAEDADTVAVNAQLEAIVGRIRSCATSAKALLET